jgi:hypothetical protein
MSDFTLASMTTDPTPVSSWAQADISNAQTNRLNLENQAIIQQQQVNKSVDKNLTKAWIPTGKPNIPPVSNTPAIPASNTPTVPVSNTPAIPASNTPTVAPNTPTMSLGKSVAGNQISTPTPAPNASNNPLQPTGQPATNQAAIQPLGAARIVPPGLPDHPISNLMSSQPQLANTDAMSTDKPMYSPVQITPQGTFDRGKFIQGLIDDGHGLEALKWQNQFKLDDANTQKLKLDANIKQNADLVGKFAAFDALPDALKPEVYQQYKQEAIADGADPNQLPDTYDPNNPKDVAFVKGLAGQALSAQDRLKDQQLQTATNIKQLAENRAQTTANNNTALATAKLAEEQRHNAAIEAIGQQRNDITKNPTGNNMPAGGDYSKPLPNPTEEQVAQGAALGNAIPRNYKDPQSMYRIQARALAVYGQQHNGDTSGFAGMPQAVKSWAPGGKNAQTITNLDTATGHIAHLGSLITALNNGNVAAINSVANTVETDLGLSAAPNNYNALVSIAVPEVLKVAKGAGVINQDEYNNLSTQARASNSPKLMQGFVDTLKHIMASRIQALEPQYEQAHPGGSITDILRPDTVATFSQPGMPFYNQKRVNPANGKTYYRHADGNLYLQPPPQ